MRPETSVAFGPPHARPDPRAQIPDPVRHPGLGAVRAPARPRAIPLHPPALQSFDAARAVQRARLPVLGRAREGVPGRTAVSRARAAARAVDDDPRRGAAPLRRGPHPGRAREQRRRLQLVLQARLEALLREVVRRSAGFGGGAVSENGGAPRDDPVGQGGDVRDPRARRAPESASRSVRRVAALSPGPRHSQFGRLLHRRRRRALLVARRRGGDVRRDVHPLGGEQDEDDPHHPVLRHRAAAHQQAHDPHQPVRDRELRQDQRDAERRRRAGGSAQPLLRQGGSSDRQPDQRFLPDAEAAQQAAFGRLQVRRSRSGSFTSYSSSSARRTRTCRRPPSASSSGRCCASRFSTRPSSMLADRYPIPLLVWARYTVQTAGDPGVAAAADGRRALPHAAARACSSSAASSCRCRRCASSARSNTCRSPRRRRSTTERRSWSSSWRWSFSARG